MAQNGCGLKMDAEISLVRDIILYLDGEKTFASLAAIARGHDVSVQTVYTLRNKVSSNNLPDRTMRALQVAEDMNEKAHELIDRRAVLAETIYLTHCIDIKKKLDNGEDITGEERAQLRQGALIYFKAWSSIEGTQKIYQLNIENMTIQNTHIESKIVDELAMIIPLLCDECRSKVGAFVDKKDEALDVEYEYVEEEPEGE